MMDRMTGTPAGPIRDASFRSLLSLTIMGPGGSDKNPVGYGGVGRVYDGSLAAFC